MHICVRILTNVLKALVWRDSKNTLCMYNIQFLRTHSTLKFRTLALNISKFCSCYWVIREELSKWILTNYFSHWISNHFFNISFHCQVMLPKSAKDQQTALHVSYTYFYEVCFWTFALHSFGFTGTIQKTSQS